MQELNQGMQGRPQNQNQFTRMTKVEFPKFSGDDVKGWIFMCEQFFDVDDIPEHQKVKLIYVHLFDIALLWNKQFIRLNGEAVSWNVYKKGILQRFGTVFDDPISEMRKIKYQSNAKDYQDVFDTLLSRVDVSEEHVVSFYLGGLPDEIEMGVRMFKPTTLAYAYQLTNYQEATLEAMRKKNKAAMSSQQGRVGGNGNGYGSNVKTPLLPLPSPTANWKTKPNTLATVPVRKQMTQKEYQEKRAQNLCFYCDQKYTPCHKCSGQLFSIVLLANEEWENEEEYIEEENPIPEEVLQVSLNALNGANSFQTLRITGKIRKHEVHILVDCGATRNFLDLNVAKQVGCKTNKTYPLEVAVGGGRKLISNVVCKNFEWQLQGETFYNDILILPLGGCEMVLGIQWLATLGDIKCNFSRLRMEFMYKDKKMTLRGTLKVAIQWLDGKK
ncbi:gypsy/ty3 retroelement polyprotein [Tanacetum coccineum]